MNMQLSLEEKKTLDSLRQQQDAWRRLRWACLIGGLALSAVGLFLRARLLSTLSSYMRDFPDVTNTGLLMTATTARGLTLCSLLVFGGFLAAVVTLIRWRGNPSTQVLLAIADRLGDHTSSADD